MRRFSAQTRTRRLFLPGEIRLSRTRRLFLPGGERARKNAVSVLSRRERANEPANRNPSTQLEVAWPDAVDEAPVEGRGGVDRTGAEDQLVGALAPDEARQPKRALDADAAGE